MAGRFAQQIVQIAAGRAEPVIETGALEPVRDFIDVRDAVRGYVALLEGRTGPGPFNVCSGVARSVGDMLREIMALAGVNPAIRQRPGAGTLPGLDVPYQCGSRAAIGGHIVFTRQAAIGLTQSVLPTGGARLHPAR